MIRQCEEKDLAEILSIYNEELVNTTAVYAYKPQTIEQRRAWYQDKIASGYPVLVCEESSSVAGFATYGQFRMLPAYKYTIEHSVYVDKRFRGKGIGSALLKEIINQATIHNYATIVAGIDSQNEASIYLHKKLGFYHAGSIKRAGYKFRKWLDLEFYQLDLNGPKSPTED